jgi:flagellar basal-body rod protein FlgB
MEVFGFLEKGLNIRAFYHRILATNIANVETPGYKEKQIDFMAELEKTGVRTENITVSEKMESEGYHSIDGNTVNIEDQMVKLAENSMMFSSFVKLISKKLSMMKYAINEGRR